MSSEEKGLRNAVMGFIIGVASILPGVSGGLIAVLCGVYERLIRDIGDIVHKWRPEFWFLVTLGGGIVIGMFVASVLLDGLITQYPVPSLFFFLGLILAQVPEVYTLARNDSPIKPVHVICLIFGLAVMAVMIIFGTGGEEMNLEHNFQSALLLVAAGIILAVSKIAPGISGSSLLLAFGLFQISISSVAHLDLYFLIPLGIGFLIGLFGFAKIMTWLLDHYHSETYYAILGLTVGSLFVIYNSANITTTNDVIVAIASAAVGVFVSYLFTLYGRRVKAKDEAKASAL